MGISVCIICVDFWFLILFEFCFCCLGVLVFVVVWVDVGK